MQRFRNLMVVMSRTAADAGLIRYAAMICRWGTVQSVRFIHVLPSAAIDQQEHSRLDAELRSTVAAEFADVPQAVRQSFDVRGGPLTDCLLSQAAEQQIDLLLVGRQSGSAGRQALVRRLAMKAPCSVWIVPEGAPPVVQRILAPVDFSESAADTIRVVIAMAQLSGNPECLALHVYFDRAVTTYEGYDQVLRGEEAEAYRKFIAPLDCQGVTVTPLFEEGANVAHVIQRVAEREGADLIVMGTRGRSASAAILLGSVTEETIIDTKLPLLAVKHFGARMGVLQALLDRRFLYSPGLRTD
jgi:SulP family sulfate permease